MYNIVELLVYWMSESEREKEHPRMTCGVLGPGDHTKIIKMLIWLMYSWWDYEWFRLSFLHLLTMGAIFTSGHGVCGKTSRVPLSSGLWLYLPSCLVFRLKVLLFPKVTVFLEASCLQWLIDEGVTKAGQPCLHLGYLLGPSQLQSSLWGWLRPLVPLLES